MTHRTISWLATLCVAFSLPTALHAQSITGYSIIEDDETPACPQPLLTTNSKGAPDFRACPPPRAEVFSETEEDYTASLYYNVQTATGEYYGISNQALVSQISNSINGTASLGFNYTYPGATADGIYSESTFHYLNFFYVAVDGGYYDPYGYSNIVNGQGDGDYGDGYWFYVNVIAIYVEEASVILGETTGAVNHNSLHSPNASTPSARSYSVLMQTFIPGNNAEAPYTPPPLCGQVYGVSIPFPYAYFAGDSRGSNPALGSYRTFQQVTLGLNGIVPPTSGVQDTGWTHLYAADSIVNGVISSAAQADPTQGDCHYSIKIGKAATSGMTLPVATGSGSTQASSELKGSAGNPLSPSGPIQWDAKVTLTQTSPTTVNVNGSLFHKCFPAYELSVGASDIDYQPPAASGIVPIFTCLSGVGSLSEPISQTLIVSP